MSYQSVYYVPEKDVPDVNLILGSQFLKYRQYAIEQHGEQMRKYQNAPYVTHLDQIASMLFIYWKDGNQNNEFDFGVCMRLAYLHDVIEDTNADFDHVIDFLKHDKKLDSRRFNSLMCALDALTDRKPLGCRYERLREYNNELFLSNVEAQVVKAFDIMSNAGSIVEHAPKFAKQYLQEKMECLGCLNKLPKALKDDCFALLMSQFLKLEK